MSEYVVQVTDDILVLLSSSAGAPILGRIVDEPGRTDSRLDSSSSCPCDIDSISRLQQYGQKE